MKGYREVLELTCSTACACLFNLRPGVLSKTLSQMWSKLNLPMFLFNVGLLTLMNMDSLIFLAQLCPSLPIIWKLLWLVGCLYVYCVDERVRGLQVFFVSSTKGPGGFPYKAVYQFSLRPDEVHSSEWKLVYKCNQSSVPEKNYFITWETTEWETYTKLVSCHFELWHVFCLWNFQF